MDPAMLLAWNSPQEKAQYQQYVENLRGSTPEGQARKELINGLHSKYGNFYDVDNSNLYDTGAEGNVAREWLWKTMDAYDTATPEMRGGNDVNFTGHDPTRGGYYDIPSKRVTVTQPAYTPFPGYPEEVMYHELMHARTFEDAPWQQEKQFIEGGWPGATWGKDSLKEVYQSSPVEWPERSRSPDMTTTEYGETNPAEDMAEYLRILAQNYIPGTVGSYPARQAEASMSAENDQRYKAAMEILKHMAIEKRQEVAPGGP